MRSEHGFSLLELVIYIAIFAVSSTFLMAILTTITRIQVRQQSANQVNQQVSFISSAIRRFVQEASVIDMPAGVSTSTLTLRTASSTTDPTVFYLASSTIYLREGTSTALALTDPKVLVDDFTAVKIENPGGRAIVEINLALSYDRDNKPGAKFSRTLQTAITRISAATFDSSLLPNSNAIYDVGSSATAWRDGYFSGNVGIGTSPSSAARLLSVGDIAFSTSSAGLILRSVNGSCFEVGITNGGQFSTSSVACP